MASKKARSMVRRRQLGNFKKGARVKYRGAHLKCEGTVYLDAPSQYGDEYCIIDWDHTFETSLEWKPNLQILTRDRRLVGTCFYK